MQTQEQVSLSDVVAAGSNQFPKSSADMQPRQPKGKADQQGVAGEGSKLYEISLKSDVGLLKQLDHINGLSQREFTCMRAEVECTDSRDSQIAKINADFGGKDAKLSKDEEKVRNRAISRERARCAMLTLFLWAIRMGHWEGLRKIRTFTGKLEAARGLRNSAQGKENKPKVQKEATESAISAAHDTVGKLSAIGLRVMLVAVAENGYKQAEDDEFSDICGQVLDLLGKNKPKERHTKLTVVNPVEIPTGERKAA